jgi:hypothetical protein
MNINAYFADSASDEFLDCFLEFFYGLQISVFYGVGNTVMHMLIDDLFSQSPQGGVHGCKLDQDICAVHIVFNHAFDMIQMTDRPGNPVELSFFFGRIMVMAVPGIVFLMGMGAVSAACMNVIFRAHFLSPS